MEYIIAIDLDNTLLDNQGLVSKENYEIIQKVKALGHHIVLATGRTCAGAIDIYNQLKLVTPLVTYNGAKVCFPNSERKDLTSFINKEDIKDIYLKHQQHILSAHYTLGDITFAYQYDEGVEKKFNGKNSQDVVEMNFANNDKDAHVFVVLVDDDYAKMFEQHIDQNFPFLGTRRWDMSNRGTVIEVHRKDVSKYSGLKKVFDVLDIKDAKLISFGDNENDIDMIKNSYLGIAVNNAVDKLKGVAYMVSPYTNNESSIAKHLTQYFFKN